MKDGCIGKNFIINNIILIMYDCVVKNQTNVSKNETINGRVIFRNICFIVSNNVIRN